MFLSRKIAKFSLLEKENLILLIKGKELNRRKGIKEENQRKKPERKHNGRTRGRKNQLTME